MDAQWIYDLIDSGVDEVEIKAALEAEKSDVAVYSRELKMLLRSQLYVNINEQKWVRTREMRGANYVYKSTCGECGVKIVAMKKHLKSHGGRCKSCTASEQWKKQKQQRR
jgi:predicted SprT family Zn-dependent metalloprotease